MLHRENPEATRRRLLLRLFAANLVVFLAIGLSSGLLHGAARVIAVLLGVVVLVSATLRFRRANRLR